jgi:hypothetical protein
MVYFPVAWLAMRMVSVGESYLLGPAAVRWSFWRGVSTGIVLSLC